MVNDVSSRNSKLYNVDDNHKANALIKPVKWCGRSIVNIGKSNAGNIIKRVSAAFAGVILFIPCGLLSLVGIAAKAISPSKPGLKVTDPKIMGLMYELFQVVDSLLEKHQIGYWLIGGSLLGQERHGSVIPWDDDMDIQTMPGAVEKLKSGAFQEDLKKHHLKLTYSERQGTYKICPNDKLLEKTQKRLGVGVNHKRYGWTWPFIDVFPSKYTDESKTKVDYDSEYARKTWPETGLWKVSGLHKDGKFKRVAFGPVKGNVPHSGTNENLNKNYGKDWSKVAYSIWDHENEVSLGKPKKVRVTKFEPAKYESHGMIAQLQNEPAKA